ncbi:MAG: dihydrofolate reductase family protein [Phycisphaerae bacterium]|nr:dihydrofolate reductase [Phycisphaerales bacterium]
MTTGHVFIATSLDGFIARTDGDLDWLMKFNTDGEDHGFDALMASVEGLVMGRGTFEKVLTFGEWPYTKPVIVLSRTMKDSDVPDHLRGKVRLSAGPPRILMEQLNAEGWRGAYVDGGKVIQSFLAEGLIADMLLTRVPVLIGEGLPLFGALPHDIGLEHLETKAFPSGLVSSKYRVNPRNAVESR